MIKIRNLLAATSILMLVGCTVSGGKAAKESYTKKAEYSVDMNWQRAFKQIKDQAVLCYSGSQSWLNPRYATGHIYSELGEAEVVVNNGDFGTYIYIEIVKDGDRAIVTGYITISNWEGFLEELEPKIIDGEEVFDFGC